jgi:hypothetical protein
MSDLTNSDIYFTKHLFRTGLECPTRLYYYANNYPENREALPFIAHYRYNKQQLINLARCSFPKAISIDSTTNESSFAETQKKLKKKRVVLFDPAFHFEHYKAKVPILEKDGKDVNIYHVQIKAFRPDKQQISNQDGKVYSKWRSYVLDFAFQVYVIKKCHPDWNIHPYFLLPAKYAHARTDQLHKVIRQINKGEVNARNTSVSDEEILAKVEVSDEINRVLTGKIFEEPFKDNTLEEVLKRLSYYFYEKEKYPVKIGNKCKGCEFRIENDRVAEGKKSGFLECWNKSLDKDLYNDHKSLVFNLIGPGTKQWVERDLYLQENVPEGEFYKLNTINNSAERISEKHRQSLQIMQAKGEEVPNELVKPKLYQELDRWEYPLHFLDFEAGNYVIPIRKERRPYHLLAFQYSCHTLYQDGSWDHREWIDDCNGDYPNYELIRRLKRIPRIGEGTIVQYSNFERNALKTIRKELLAEEGRVKDTEELTGWISDIIQRNDSSHKSGPYLSDLSRLVKNYYYNAEMEDSLSIKDVLQSIMAISPRLKDIYSKPYNSSNYDAAIWWQSDNQGSALNPYRLMFNTKNDEAVSRGTEAMVVYASLLSENLSPGDRERYRKALLRYCELDTLAMVMIYQHWKYLMEENWN